MSWETTYPILRRVEVRCHRCGRWVPFRRLERDFHSSPYTGWRKDFYCPHCGQRVGGSHGSDPGYNIEPAHFEETIVGALHNGADWVRLGPESREA
jgi:DNA-directed RNA polymerase subunit RPC12/RpoP